MVDGDGSSEKIEETKKQLHQCVDSPALADDAPLLVLYNKRSDSNRLLDQV